jgi:hypothetical protein
MVADCTLFTSERLGGPASSVLALVDTDIGMEMVEVAGERLLGNVVEVTTYFINDGNINNCRHIDTKLGIEMGKGSLIEDLKLA